MTVSRVINGKTGVGEGTRQRVQQAIESLGYRPNGMARGLKVRRSQTIGLLVPDITNPYFPEIVRGAEDIAFERGYTVFLCNVIEDPKREAAMLRLMEEKRVDGVILCSPRLADKKLFALLRHHHAAVVVNRAAPRELAGVVRLDHEVGIQEAVTHLVETGRTRLALLAGPETSQGSRERIQGFRGALKQHGLESGPIIACSPYLDAGQAVTGALLAEYPEVDGLLCFNDLIAAGALQACAELGRQVPDELAVVGFDDIPFAKFFTPPLTTLHVPKYDLGASAMRLLLDRLEGRNLQMEVVLRPKLIVRSSTIRKGDR